MQPTDYVIKDGHRIGVVIISSDYEYTIRPKPGTTISIHPEQSYLSLPLVGDITKEPSSVKRINDVIKYYEEQNAFSDTSTSRQLQTHLTAVQHYENEGNIDKTSKHLQGFKFLLDYHRHNMTEEVYDILHQ